MALATVDNIDEYLASASYNTKRCGSLGGGENLFRGVKEEGKFKLIIVI